MRFTNNFKSTFLVASFPGLADPECKHWSCAGVESLVFFAREQFQGCRETLIVCGCTQRLNRKGTKVVYNILHISSNRGSNILHTERWTHSWLKTYKMLPFCSKNSGPILITSWSCEKRYQALPAYTSSCSGARKPGNEALFKAKTTNWHNSHPAIFLVRVWWSTRLAPTVQQQYLEKMSHWESWSLPLPQRATPRCLHLAPEFLACSVNVCGRMASIQPQLQGRNSMAVWRLQQLG